MPRVKHVALLKLKKQTPPGEIAAMFSELAALRQKIAGVLDFSAGPYSSPEGLNQGFTHGFVMTFADEHSRDGYLTHPAHEVVKERIIPMLDGDLEGVIVVDWLEESPAAEVGW